MKIFAPGFFVSLFLSALISIAALSLSTSSSMAVPRGSLVPTVSTCPNGTVTPDGCQSANSASAIQYSPRTFFTLTAPQSVQSYISANPESDLSLVTTAWNAPGIDYPIGPYTSRALANDPQVSANYPSQCTLTVNSSPNYGVLNCSATPTYTWHNLDFGSVNGHGPTFLVFHNNTAGAQTFDDVWFTESSSCPVPAATGGLWIDVETTQSVNFTFQYLSWDGNDPTCRAGFTNGNTSLIPIEAFTSANVLIDYSFFNDVQGVRAFTFGCSTASNCVFQHSMIHNWLYSPAGGHGEFDTITPNSGQQPNVTFQYIVSWNDKSGPCDCSTTAAYLSNGSSGNFGTVTVDHAIILSNTISGTQTTNGATIGYSIGNSSSGGEGTGDGYYFTVNSLAAGAVLTEGQSISGTGWLLDSLVSGSGVGSIWRVSCLAPYTGCTEEANGVYMANSQTTGSTTLGDQVIGPLVEAAHNGFHQIYLTNILGDWTGGTGSFNAISFSGGPPWGPSNGVNGCDVASIFSNDYNIVTGASLTGWSAGTAGGGC